MRSCRLLGKCEGVIRARSEYPQMLTMRENLTANESKQRFLAGQKHRDLDGDDAVDLWKVGTLTGTNTAA